MFSALFGSMAGAFIVPRGFGELAWLWIPLVGFLWACPGFPPCTCRRYFRRRFAPLGPGYCYNVGRLAAAAASVVFGWAAPVGDFRLALLASSGLALAAAVMGLVAAGDNSRIVKSSQASPQGPTRLQPRVTQ